MCLPVCLIIYSLYSCLAVAVHTFLSDKTAAKVQAQWWRCLPQDQGTHLLSIQSWCHHEPCRSWLSRCLAHTPGSLRSCLLAPLRWYWPSSPPNALTSQDCRYTHAEVTHNTLTIQDCCTHMLWWQRIYTHFLQGILPCLRRRDYQLGMRIYTPIILSLKAHF